jgi:hypothetical protein
MNIYDRLLYTLSAIIIIVVGISYVTYDRSNPPKSKYEKFKEIHQSWNPDVSYAEAEKQRQTSQPKYDFVFMLLLTQIGVPLVIWTLQGHLHHFRPPITLEGNQKLMFGGIMGHIAFWICLYFMS